MTRILAALASVLMAVGVVACTPHVEGDSLVLNASYPTNYVTGATVKGNVGHDPCQDEQEIIDTANSKQPDRLVLAYVGNFYSAQVRPAYDALGSLGLARRYADCFRDIRSKIPAATQLVVGAVIAAGPGNSPRGDKIINQFVRPAILGGTYPLSSTYVAPLPNARYTTALDDRMTPGHVYRAGDSGGTLRSTDRLHLTTYGSKVYGGVLSQMAAGTDSGGVNSPVARR